MKKKFSLNELMHNDKLMMALSLVIAIVVWALVVNGPANIKTKVIRKEAAIDLTDTYAQSNNIRVIDTPDLTVEVTVSGPRSVTDYLGSEDIVVKAETNLILGAGPSILNISVSKTNKNADFEITSYTPSSITVHCDYWRSVELPVKADVSSVHVEDPDTQQLGEPILDKTHFQNGVIRLEGPKTTIDKVVSLVARVQTDKPISAVQVFTADLIALDADGNEVDLKGCTFINPSTGDPIQLDTINVTVPVHIQRTVDFSYELLHVPPAFESNPNLITLSVPSITLVGPQESVESAANSLANLGTFDFDHLTPADAVRVIPLNIPQGVTVLENVSEVTVRLDIAAYASKTVELTLMTAQDVTFLNRPADKVITVAQQVKQIQIFGSAASIEAITAADLKATVDAGSNPNSGSVRYPMRIDVPGYDDVWVYYGAEGDVGYEIYASVN